MISRQSYFLDSNGKIVCVGEYVYAIDEHAEICHGMVYKLHDQGNPSYDSFNIEILLDNGQYLAFPAEYINRIH